MRFNELFTRKIVHVICSLSYAVFLFWCRLVKLSHLLLWFAPQGHQMGSRRMRRRSESGAREEVKDAMNEDISNRKETLFFFSQMCQGKTVILLQLDFCPNMPTVFFRPFRMKYVRVQRWITEGLQVRGPVRSLKCELRVTELRCSLLILHICNIYHAKIHEAWLQTDVKQNNYKVC